MLIGVSLNRILGTQSIAPCICCGVPVQGGAYHGTTCASHPIPAQTTKEVISGYEEINTKGNRDRRFVGPPTRRLANQQMHATSINRVMFPKLAN